MENKPQQIIVDIQVATTTLQQVLALLRASSSALAAVPVVGQISLGLSAVTGLVLPLIDALFRRGEISIAEQKELQAEVEAILSGKKFDGPQWQPRPESK